MTAINTSELDEIIAFLLGEQPMDGLWFGEYNPQGNYWWRKKLRKAYKAHLNTSIPQAEGSEK